MRVLSVFKIFQIVQMNNYCGLGIDAELSLGFHHAREEEPDKFNSRYLQPNFQLTHDSVCRGWWTKKRTHSSLVVVRETTTFVEGSIIEGNITSGCNIKACFVPLLIVLMYVFTFLWGIRHWLMTQDKRWSRTCLTEQERPYSHSGLKSGAFST